MPLALIAGAGIGGLGAAVALRRAGWDVLVFERAAAPRELGFGLVLAPNAIAALRELGVEAQVVAQGVSGTRAEMRRSNGRVLRRLQVDDARPGGDRPTVILRPVLHGALLEAAGPEAVRLSSAVVAFEASADAVTIRLADGSSCSGDLLIGADGIGSTVRAQLHPGEPPPRPSGYIALRGTSPAVDRLAGLHAILSFGPGVECGIAQASPTRIYWYLSLLAEDVPGGLADARVVLDHATQAFDAQVRTITDATAPSDLRLDRLMVRDPLPAWGAGPVTLLGDAAHPMLPHTGQGAAQALEDAAALGRELALAGSHTAALRSYERLRMVRACRIARSGPRIARITTTRSRMVAALRNAAIRVAPTRVIISAYLGWK